MCVCLQLLCRFAISYNIFHCQRFVSCSSTLEPSKRACQTLFCCCLFFWYFTSASYTFNNRLVGALTFFLCYWINVLIFFYSFRAILGQKKRKYLFDEAKKYLNVFFSSQEIVKKQPRMNKSTTVETFLNVLLRKKKYFKYVLRWTGMHQMNEEKNNQNSQLIHSV